jgi:hypothetical protein
LRIALYHLPELAQLTNTLLIGTLGIGRIARRVSRNWPLDPLAITVISRVDVPPNSTIRPASATISNISAQVPARSVPCSLLAESSTPLQAALRILARLLSASPLLAYLPLLSCLTLLVAILSGLVVLARPPIAPLLTVLAILALLAAITPPRSHRFKLAPKALDLVQRCRLVTLSLSRATLSRLALTNSLLRLPKLLA